MNQKNKILQNYGLWLLDLICITLSYWVATNLRFAGNNDWGAKRCIMRCWWFSCFFIPFTASLQNGTGIFWREAFKELLSVLQYNGVMILASLAFVFFAQWGRILSRQVIVNFIWINLLMMYVAHILFREALRRVVTSEKQVIKVLVVALPELVDETISKLRTELGITYQIVGSASVRCVQGDTDRQRALRFQEMTEKLTQIPFDEVF